MAGLFLLTPVLPAARAADVTVDTFTDEWNNGGTCSIREALNAVRRGRNDRGCTGVTAPDGWGVNDTIWIPAGTYTLTRTGNENRSRNDLDVEADVTLQGQGGSDIGTIIDGNGVTSVIEIQGGNTVILSDISIQSGTTGTNYHGAGIHNNGTLTLRRVNVVNNVGTGNGVGGIGNDGTLTISGSSISLNSNANAAVGAGIDNNGAAMTITTSTISGNAGAGPGVFHYNDGTAPLSVVFSTFANNGTGYDSNSTAGAFSNTIVNDACGTNVTDNGYNTDAGTGCGLGAGTSQSSTSVALGPLDFHGGPTLSHAIDSTDTAVYDRIPSGTNGCGTTYTVDQRTASRPSPALGSCDIGAYEYDAAFTVAVVTAFRAYGSGPGGMVEWETGSEVGTAGFHLERYDRDRGEYVAVNNEVIPSVGAPQGGTYRQADPAVRAGERHLYRLQELDVTGRRGPYGPFAVTVEGENIALPSHVPAGRLSVAHSMPAEKAAGAAGRLAERRLVAAELRAARRGRSVKVGVSEDGLYYLEAAQVAAKAGVSKAKIRSLIAGGRLRLTNRGSGVPWFGASAGRGLYFYGEGIESTYTRFNVYRVALGEASIMESVDGAPPAAAPDGQTFVQTARFEEDVEPFTSFADDPDTDHWYWGSLFSGSPTMESVTVDAGLSSAVPSARARLQLTLKGIPFLGFSTSHKVGVEVNGTPVGELTWSGSEQQGLWLSLPQSLLVDGANQVKVTVIKVGGLESFIVLDSIDFRYHRSYRADGGTTLHLTGGRNDTVTIDGFSGKRIAVLDVTDPSSPRLVDNVLRDRGDGYRVSFQPASATARYLAATLDGALSPAWMTAGADLPDRGTVFNAEYLVITPPELVDTARGLADLRAAAGLRTAVVALDAVYDAFNYGIASPHALRDFLGLVYRKGGGQLRYVVLAGEGSFDFRDLQGFGDSMVPPWLAATPHGLFVSDIGYGDTNLDGVPEFIVGRLPVDSATELSAYVQKIRGNAAGIDKVLMLADDGDADSDFPALSARAAGMVPATVPLESISLADVPLATARTRLFSSLQSGAGLVNYLGHGSVLQITHEGWLKTADVPGLGNQGKYPVLLALTCVISRYGLPGYDSLAEELVVSPDSGAIAVFGPAGLSQASGAEVLNEALMQAIYSGGERILGDAVGRALHRYSRSGISPYMSGIYNIVGDPASEIAVP